jgi:TonB family protein
MVRAFLKQETTVSVQVQVDERGVVTRAEVIRFPGLSPYVATLVRNAALSWRFRPAERNGQRVRSEYLIGFQFKP